MERRVWSFRAASLSPVDEAITRIIHIGSAPREKDVSAAASVHMIGVASAVSDKDLKAAAQWFSAQAPAHGRNGKGKANEEGRALFVDGEESRGLRACQGCHGAEAQGSETAPRLAGQHAAYIGSQLTLFRAGSHPESPEMTVIARYLSESQARAVAAYLETR
jgi:cytochrome c553